MLSPSECEIFVSFSTPTEIAREVRRDQGRGETPSTLAICLLKASQSLIDEVTFEMFPWSLEADEEPYVSREQSREQFRNALDSIKAGREQLAMPSNGEKEVKDRDFKASES